MSAARALIEDQPNIDAVVVPFGGGGLVCGIGSVMRRLKPAVRMIVVESEAAQPAAAAGAASVAAAMAGLAGTGNIVCIVSGGNIDAPKLGAILNGQSAF